MDTEDLVINDDAQSQKIKHISKIVPDISVPVLPRAFGVEPVGLCNAARFMVPSNQMYSVWISQLETYKQRDSLYAK